MHDDLIRDKRATVGNVIDAGAMLIKKLEPTFKSVRRIVRAAEERSYAAELRVHTAEQTAANLRLRIEMLERDIQELRAKVSE